MRYVTQEQKHCYLQDNGITIFFDSYVFESGINKHHPVLDKCCQVFVDLFTDYNTMFLSLRN